ncbi:uncharacterized protein [Henckelia pumila]|uniref:uncharacterized protein n=1 Tax=Henckelia pumila TaxID=405737 RepID=UPI003C6E4581
MDIVGPFPISTGQRKFLLVAVDYFSKWVGFRQWEIVLWTKVRAWCQEMNIEQIFTSVAYPQWNGQVEVTNRTIVQALKTRLDTAKGKWVEELPSVLWSYRTTA